MAIGELRLNDRLAIAAGELRFTYVRSSGPGGQNVNKVNSKAVLRWHTAGSTSLPADVRKRFLLRFASRLTSEGELILSSDRYRDQLKNAEDCLDRLRRMLLEVAQPPKRRKKTRPPRSSVHRRLMEKKHQKQRKQGRRSPPVE